MGFIEFQLWCSTDRLDEVWCVECDLVEEGYRQMEAMRSVDAGHEIFQIFADPFEPQRGENA